jgi:hypothetical protein
VFVDLDENDILLEEYIPRCRCPNPKELAQVVRALVLVTFL